MKGRQGHFQSHGVGKTLELKDCFHYSMHFLNHTLTMAEQFRKGECGILDLIEYIKRLWSSNYGFQNDQEYEILKYQL